MAGSKKTIKVQKAAKQKSKLISLPEIFSGAGFVSIPSDSVHFSIQNRTGEIDFIFAHENVIVLCEETTATNNISSHLSKKRLFHSIIKDNSEEFFNVYCEKNANFKSYVDQQDYTWEDVELRHIYFSSAQDCDSSLAQHATPLRIMRRSDANYFKSLIKVIGKSSKFEVLKYLGVSLAQIGVAKSAGSPPSFHSYEAFVLSGTHTNYPSGFGIVSFYADPASLIQRAYVLRRDGWEDTHISYQRFLVPAKLLNMRAYLAATKRVFVNNLIVTLPGHVQITDTANSAVDISKTFRGRASLVLPDEFGTVGIVDGQHRIFSYHEGTDSAEAQIKSLRRRQNLLVTGIVFPANFTAAQRAKFEAELFLSINNTQTKVKADLRQELEALIKPASTIAICKAVISRLAKGGPLAGLLQVGLYDPPEKIRTSSLVRYVLPSLLKADGEGSLYQHFDGGAADIELDDKREQYVVFCQERINALLLALASRLKTTWQAKRRGEAGILSPTSIGGFLLLLRDIIQYYDDPFEMDFDTQLDGVENFDFSPYTSSAWAQLGATLFDQFFSE